MRILVLVTDAFGGHGGIAKFNRDLLTALCSHPEVAEVVALPRIMEAAPGPLPAKLTWNTTGLGGKLRYLQALLSLRHASRSTLHAPRCSGFDLVLCAHINLLPLAFLARRLARNRLSDTPHSALRTPHSKPPLVLMTHGIEAWTPRRSLLTNRLASRVDAFVSVSELTKQRFRSWTGLAPERGRLLPNCVEASLFGPGPKSPALLDRYGLRDKTVLLTLGRLSSAERYKGVDEVLELLPELGRRIPNLAYLVVGDGDDRPRLMDKARSLGLQVVDCTANSAPRSPISAFQHFSVSAFPRVVFPGRIPDAEKADHYRLADAYVMPGWGEGFGIVYLEALACGIPVVASKADASREAVRNGELGILVDPKAPSEIRDGILAALQRPRGVVPPGLDYFSTANFTRRVHSLVKELVQEGVPKLAALDMDGSTCQRAELREALKL